jgi:hypothetical protein
MVSKPVKQLYLSFEESEIYLDKYYSLLQP